MLNKRCDRGQKYSDSLNYKKRRAHQLQWWRCNLSRHQIFKIISWLFDLTVSILDII